MAEDQKPKLDLPWGTLLPLIAVVAGIVAQFKPLVSSRPSIPGEEGIEVIAEQDVDARLWQDPLVVAQKAKAQLDEDLLKRRVPEGRVRHHRLEALVHNVREAAKEQVLLLAVMLDAGPYIEQGESRLRARQAVLEGLNESGFVPVDGEHIGFVTIPGQKSPVWEAKLGEEPVEDGALLIPWEECRASDDAKHVYPAGTKHVFVLWLPASSFDPRPLECFAEKLVKPLVDAVPENLKIKLLGPANSTGLRNMAKEGPQPQTEGHANFYDALDGVDIISPRATASDEALLEGEGDVKKIIQSYVPKRIHGGLSFCRTIKTDDLVLKELIAELKLRHVYVAPRWDGKHWVEGDRVVILTEWDNPYGRSLASTFRKEAKGASVRFYRYMHGIDGRLPGDPAKSGDDVARAHSGQAPPVVEATEGLDQSDFLRRLGRELKDEDTDLWRKGKPGIRAIGLLGSDIFDKLMILRALRPQFRDAIFFTNNLDAHFERRDDWSDVRNLVVASPFGLRLAPIKSKSVHFRQRVAPFRDNTQTSMFFGTLVATERFKNDVLEEELRRQPRLFEIERSRSRELHKEEPGGDEDNGSTTAPHWFRNWFFSWRVGLRIGLAAIGLTLLAGWIGLSIVDRRLPGGGGPVDRLKRICSSTTFTLICGVPVIVLAVALFAQAGKAVDEPLAFFSGISIWPSEMLRLVALLLAVHFMIKAHFDLRANEREITRRFFPGLEISAKWSWGLGAKWMSDEAHFSAREAWAAYLRRNRFWPRFIRVGALFGMYAAFSFGVFSIFPRVITPARGDPAFIADIITLIPTVIAMMLLTFYVVDAIRLNSNFIRILTRGATEWEPQISDELGRIPPLDPGEMARYHDIFFVAHRTEEVAPLIWYPLIVLAIMIVARSSFFDHWTWPISLILIFALNAAWAFGSAMFLRRSAEQLRSAAISNLQWLRAKSGYFVPGKRRTFAELIGEIRGVKKGAFAPLTEQPFIRAIVYPSGGLGLLAVIQRLFESF